MTNEIKEIVIVCITVLLMTFIICAGVVLYNKNFADNGYIQQPVDDSSTYFWVLPNDKNEKEIHD